MCGMQSRMHHTDLLEKHFRLTPQQKKSLAEIRIRTVGDLLYRLPSRYGEETALLPISGLAKDANVSIAGKIIAIKTAKAYRKKIPLTEATIEDDTGTIRVVWFHQAYIAKTIPEGSLVRLTGKVTESKRGMYLANPHVEKISDLPLGTDTSLWGAGAGDIIPVYPETRALSSRWFLHHIRRALTGGAAETMEDTIPTDILARYHLPKVKTALIWAHMPQRKEDAESARKRFSFEEIFFIQLARQKERRAYQAHGAFVVPHREEDMRRFLSRFPFNPTAAQKRAIGTITEDFGREKPMLRLLEGDVGSGKTLVAAATAHAAVATSPKGQTFGNLQVAYMAPTEILAQQHFDSFISYFSHLPIHIALITGSGCKKFPSKVAPDKATDISRTQLLKWVANGEIAIVIGTHALIQKSVKFRDLAYVIIDEQHRFGTMQRSRLARKDNRVPHLLSMTATPIPRTLALTIYGDLDLTLLDEMPPGRKIPKTEVVIPAERTRVYEAVREEIKNGRQAYVICPRINEPDPNKIGALQVKSVKEEAKRLQEKVFSEFRVGILHGKMKPKEKDAAMGAFSRGGIDILVATSVVEVGVNVPNATTIIIEGAERFGLAQLHQLRGRVLRSSHQAYCYLFTDTESGSSQKRLKAMEESHSGFELAERDLLIRGAGELSGAKQWGISDVGMEAIKNIKMVEAARTEAQKLLDADPTLYNHTIIAHHIATKKIATHFE